MPSFSVHSETNQTELIENGIDLLIKNISLYLKILITAKEFVINVNEIAIE